MTHKHDDLNQAARHAHPVAQRPAVAGGAERGLLISALLALGATYAVWLYDDNFPILALVVFALPPLALGVAVAAGRRTAGFWAGVLALFWFSHGVMLAWSEPSARGWAMLVVLLSVVVVFASSMRGLIARFSRRPKPDSPSDPGTDRQDDQRAP